MINPSEIVDNLVDLMRRIPDLVSLVDGDPERIYAYHDRYPEKVSIETARYQQENPSIMVYYQGTTPGTFGGGEVWRHAVEMSVRAPAEDDNGYRDGYYEIFRQITRGVPVGQENGDELRLIQMRIHESCDLMDTPTMQRQSDANGIDYFEVSTAFTEIGDD